MANGTGKPVPYGLIHGTGKRSGHTIRYARTVWHETWHLAHDTGFFYCTVISTASERLSLQAWSTARTCSVCVPGLPSQISAYGNLVRSPIFTPSSHHSTRWPPPADLTAPCRLVVCCTTPAKA